MILRHAHPLFDDPARPDGPPLTPALVAQAEARLGMRLPSSYVATLQLCNGGRLRRTRFPLMPREGWMRDHVGIRDLTGLGYPGGLEESRRWISEWDYPSPGLVISPEGPWALMLDYRRVGPDGEPPVIFVNTDEEQGGQPLCWTIAPNFAALIDGLGYAHDRSQVALTGLDEHGAVELMRAVGGEGKLREDYEGGQSLALPGRASWEQGVAIQRLLANRLGDGRLRLPELPQVAFILETTLKPAEAATWLTAVERAAPQQPILLYMRPASAYGDG